MDEDEDIRVSPAEDGDESAVPPRAASLPRDDPAEPPDLPDLVDPGVLRDPAEDGAFLAFLTGGAYGTLALLGLVLGVVGSFHFGWRTGSFPLAAVLLVALNFALPWLAGRLMGTKIAAAVPWVTWALVVTLLSTGRSEGDLVVTGDLAGYLFIMGGLVTGGVAVALTRSPSHGSWLLGPGVDRR
ncbi:DUF6113 family protein [Thermomonospora umbrina]|uniref:DUF6113 family protein n=1 Tax=Thermomonospora umbrina TaxID=111806 RepID=UPI000E25078A|nr:DUF6113 family protein [Thermomonospora umbrina]